MPASGDRAVRRWHCGRRPVQRRRPCASRVERDQPGCGSIAFTLELHGTQDLRFLLRRTRLRSGVVEFPRELRRRAPARAADHRRGGFHRRVARAIRAPVSVAGLAMSPVARKLATRAERRRSASVSVDGDIISRAASREMRPSLYRPDVSRLLHGSSSGSRCCIVQYVFVGFALCVFYLLLLSLSEHFGFDIARHFSRGHDAADSGVCRAVLNGGNLAARLRSAAGALRISLPAAARGTRCWPVRSGCSSCLRS